MSCKINRRKIYYRECDLIIAEFCSDIEKIEETEILCNKILSYVNDRIDKGEKQFREKLPQNKYNIFNIFREKLRN